MADRPDHVERIPMGHLQGRLSQIGASFSPESSDSLQHIYHSRSLGSFISVSRRGGLAELSYYKNCPCSG